MCLGPDRSDWYRPKIVKARVVVVGLVILSAACSHPAKRSSGSSTTVPQVIVAAVSPREMCKHALGAGVALNVRVASVEEVRAVRIGPGYRPAKNAFPRAAPTDRAAWCWTGRPGSYTLIAVGPTGTTKRVEGLHGAAFDSTPAPGPAPVP